MSNVERLDNMLSKTERIFGAAKIFMTLLIFGALWVFRIEYTQADHEQRITETETDLKPLATDLAKIKGHLHLAANTTPPAEEPTNTVVWTEEQRRQEEENCLNEK